MSFRPTVLAVALACAMLVPSAPAHAQQKRAPRNAPQTQPNADNIEIQTLRVQGNVYVLAGAGGNTTVQVGEDGVLVVDTGLQQAAPKLLAAIRKVSDKPIVWIVNTHVHADHTGGNEEFAKAGPAAAGSGAPLGAAAGGIRIIAQQNVLDRMSADPTGNEPAIPEIAWPNDAYFTASKDFFFNDEAVIVSHMPAAHTDGDSIVFFRRSDVVSTGDLFVPGRYPLIDSNRGGSLQGIIEAMNAILEITVPRRYQEGGTYVVPGHGRLCDEAEVVEYRDMLTIIRDRVQDMIGKGMTLAQVKAARPTKDYDTEYGADTGMWTTDMFVEAVYKSLSKT
jgi:cyclase